jgi:hypothetical protein
MPINGLILLGIVGAGISVIRPDWVRLHWLMRVLVDAGNLIIGFFLLKTGEPIVVAHLGTTPDAAHVEQIMNQTIHYGIWFAVAMAMVQVVKDLRHLVSSRAVRTEKAAAEA